MPEDNMTDEMEFNRDSDVPPDLPVPAGFYEATVAGIRMEGPDGDRAATLYPDCIIARVTYRLESEDPDLNGKRVDNFPVPVKGHKDSWKWFDWCKKMGYETDKPFRFMAADVEGARVSLKFGPPRVGKTGTKSEGKTFSNLEAVQRLNG